MRGKLIRQTHIKVRASLQFNREPNIVLLGIPYVYLVADCGPCEGLAGHLEAAGRLTSTASSW